MRIIQTFWTAGKNPLEYSFGWYHSEYNVMSWAFSCLCLREHYSEVALYTDQAGKHLLIDQLHLPYTEVHVVYDETLCLPHHWAYAKIMTYNQQTKPFIHVDGDFYLSKRIPADLLTSEIITQNKEIGTNYYRSMMERIKSYPNIVLPEFVEQGLKDYSIASYNMGIFGGTDLSFIHQYCKEVINFMEYNKMNDSSCANSQAWCNILFEQIFLATMAEKQNKIIGCLGRDTKDEGYTREEFCNLLEFEEHSFFHVLGGHKQNKYTCEMLAKVLLSRHPTYFLKVYKLFPKYNTRLVLHNQMESPLNVESCIATYEDFLKAADNEMTHISFEKLFLMEKICGNVHRLVHSDSFYKKKLRCNPYLRKFNLKKEWPKEAKSILRTRLNVPLSMSEFSIVVIPELGGRGIKELGVSTLGMNIIQCLSNDFLTMTEVSDRLAICWADKESLKKNKDQLILKEIEYLLFWGAIALCD